MNPLDPNCAICNAPPQAQCPCEAERLEIAVRQAEHRMLDAMMADVRDWVIQHARSYVLQSFTRISGIRKAQHSNYLASLHQASYYSLGGAHPAQLHAAEVELKRGIDEDWRRSVQSYPEVLDYFYGLVDINLPSDSSLNVTEPALDGRKRAHRSKRRESFDADPPRTERRRVRRDRDGGVRGPSLPTAPPPPPPPQVGGHGPYGW